MAPSFAPKAFLAELSAENLAECPSAERSEIRGLNQSLEAAVEWQRQSGGSGPRPSLPVGKSEKAALSSLASRKASKHLGAGSISRGSAPALISAMAIATNASSSPPASNDSTARCNGVCGVEPPRVMRRRQDARREPAAHGPLPDHFKRNTKAMVPTSLARSETCLHQA
jgi:hypothetical protein